MRTIPHRKRTEGRERRGRSRLSRREWEDTLDDDEDWIAAQEF